MGVVLLAMTIGVLLFAGLLWTAALWKKIVRLKKFAFGAVAIWCVFYGALLLGTSLLSEEKTLGPNEWKTFCGFYLDCHLKTSVSDVRRTKTLGGQTAKGEFWVVTVKVFNDAGRARLGLHAPDALIVDERGRTFERDREAESALIGSATETPFDLKISPGRSLEKQLVFDLPADAENARLDIFEGLGPGSLAESVLIGDEDSLLHRRKYFRLEEQPENAGVK